jgi:hypothetical protein
LTGSSEVEPLAVNEAVAGSTPAPSANDTEDESPNCGLGKALKARGCVRLHDPRKPPANGTAVYLLNTKYLRWFDGERWIGGEELLEGDTKRKPNE